MIAFPATTAPPKLIKDYNNRNRFGFFTGRINISILKITKIKIIKEEKLSEINDFRGLVVAGTGEISNFDLLKDLTEVVDYLCVIEF